MVDVTVPVGTRADAAVAGDCVTYRGHCYRVDAVHLGRLDCRLDVTPYDPKSTTRFLVLRRREILDVTHV